ncbi:MAG: NOL1/NOP2/sun family putative RNA methylase [Bellilinea sp.]
MSRKKKRNPQSILPEAAQNAALERFKPLLTPTDYQVMLEELAQPLPLAFRSNPLKAKPGAEQEWAQRYGWQLEPVSFCPTGWRVTEMQTSVSMTLEHRMGHYYIQDAASMLPVELFELDPLDRPLVLDMAASPGGKTTHLTARLLDHGLVIANDSSSDRITALRLVLQAWGAANVAVTRFPGDKFGRWYPETFDRILLDAPCSMQGLRSTDSHPMRPITSREQDTLARRQASLLVAAIAALKPGGQVVYSTCTLAPEEDEAVLDKILRRFSSSIVVEGLESRLPSPAPGLAGAYGRNFDPQVIHAARLWPHRFHTSGFFAALIRKVGPVDFPREEPPDRPLSLVGQKPLAGAAKRDLFDFYRNQFGHDLEPILETYGLEMWHSAAGIFAVPSTYLQHFGGLPCHLLGLKLAEETPDGLSPAHDWVARFGSSFTAGRVVIPHDLLAPWLRGEDLDFAPGGELHSGMVVLYDPDERCLGRGRLQAGKIKNLLPRRLV